MMILQKPDLPMTILMNGILTLAIFSGTILMVGILIKMILRRTIFTVATMIIRILKTIYDMDDVDDVDCIIIESAASWWRKVVTAVTVTLKVFSHVSSSNDTRRTWARSGSSACPLQQ